MATFHFELVSPERIIFSGEVDQVDVPGVEGYFGVLAGHAPLVTVLRPGILTVMVGDEKREIIVLGGFAEVGPKGLTVLADIAWSMEDLDRAVMEAQIREIEERIKSMAQGSQLDREITKLDHFRVVHTHMQGTGMH